MKTIHYIIYIALAAIFFTACQEDELVADYGEGTGTLVLSGIEVVSEVGDIQTRASMDDADIPSAEDFTIELLDANTQELVQELKLDTRYNLEAGSYIVRAYYGEESAMSYTPYFMDEEETVISNGTTKTVRLMPSLQQAIIHPKMTETLISQYKNYKLSIAQDDGEAIELENDKDFFLPIEDCTYTLTLMGTNVLDELVSYDWEYQGSQFVARTRYIVNCNPNLPSFTLPAQAETNAWSKFVYVTPMTTENISYKPNGLTDEEILANIKYEISTDGQSWTQAVKINDQWVVKDLTPGTAYKLRANFFEVYSNIAQVTTENGAGVPNGDFEDLVETINMTINQGGRWTQAEDTWFTTATRYQTTLSMIVSEPSNWASINQKTCSSSASNQNSWYVIPSTFNTSLSWLSHQPEAKIIGIGQDAYDSTADIYSNLSASSGNNAMVIRNVAWDLNGASIDDNVQTGNTSFSNYYCDNIPSVSNRSAGKLFLGSYSYNGTETYNEGINFDTRPISLKGSYKYVNDSQDAEEKGTVTVQILNGETVIASGNTELGVMAEYAEFVVPLNYTDINLKATQLRIMISSSNHENESDIKTTNYCNKDECCSRGAMLTVDNLTFSYEYPSNNE